MTLTIKPGTVLKFEDGTGISVTTRIDYNYVNNQQEYYVDEENSGKLIMQGTPDSLIVIDGSACEPSPGFVFMSSMGGSVSRLKNPIFVEYLLFKDVPWSDDCGFGGYFLRTVFIIIRIIIAIGLCVFQDIILWLRTVIFQICISNILVLLLNLLIVITRHFQHQNLSISRIAPFTVGVR